MWAAERQQRILVLLSGRGQVSTERLARELGVSRETVRRDVLELEAAGRLRRLHGGVVPMEEPAEPPFGQRRAVMKAEKARIAAAAAALVGPGECLFVEAGTTTSAFALALAPMPDVTVITNSLEVAGTLQAAQPEAGTLLLGGRVGGDVPGTFGELTVEMVRGFAADVAVLSPVTLSSGHGAMSYHLAEAVLARAMVARAGRVLVMADSSKLGRSSRVAMVACDRIDVLVTDTGADPEELDRLRVAGVGKVVLS